MQEKIKALQAQKEAFSLLYVEDNNGLRQNVEKLVDKFFHYIYLAQDGLEGLELFRKHQPQIVITDIKMPKMDGLSLANKIQEINPKTKVIVMSAHDSKEHLHEAIRSNVFRYINKPAKIANLVDTLTETQHAIKREEYYTLFQNQLQDVFHYQHHLVMMFENDVPVLVNQRFLEFFGVEDLKAFQQHHSSLDALLLEHNGFLFSSEETQWYPHAKQFPGKLFHTKVLNRDGEARHLILKLQTIPNKENYTILSFDDITELNLLTLFDSKATKRDQTRQTKETIMKMMKVIHDNAAEVKLHHYYKGLTITNPAVIAQIEEKIVLKTAYTQLKAAHLTKPMIISSEVFPSNILCRTHEAIDFDRQTITLSDMQFAEQSPTERAFIRLEPESDHTVTLFYRDLKIFSESRIVDISERSVKVELYALPAGIKVEENLRISMVLPSARGPLSLNTNAKIYRIDEQRQKFHIVLMLELGDAPLSQLKHYLADRQMALIREFKALDVSAK